MFKDDFFEIEIDNVEPPFSKLNLSLPEFKFDLDFSVNSDFSNFQPEQKKFQSVDLKNDIFNQTPQNNRSWVTLSHQDITHPGLGYTNTVSGAYNFKLNDNVTLSAGMYAGKYSVNDYFKNDAGISGNIRLTLSDHFALDFSGRYSFNKMQSVFGSSMFPQTGFGGALEYKANDTWGIKLGTLYEYDVIRNQWVLKPYIIPMFYKSLFKRKKKKISEFYY
ncbi:MAG: hypothetical protein LBR52_06770 [Prevotellaceae bacterium]|jgi:hypothetical protein|nr:hypothetical protein [Prevotellaceae bacterium]